MNWKNATEFLRPHRSKVIVAVIVAILGFSAAIPVFYIDITIGSPLRTFYMGFIILSFILNYPIQLLNLIGIMTPVPSYIYKDFFPLILVLDLVYKYVLSSAIVGYKERKPRVLVAILIMVLPAIVLWFVSFSSIPTVRISVVLGISDVYCEPSGGNITVWIRNYGIENSGMVTLRLYAPNQNEDGSCIPIINIGPGIEEKTTCAGRTQGSGDYEIRAIGRGSVSIRFVHCTS